MISPLAALELASEWVRIVCGDRFVLIKERTITKPYGWVFFYGSRNPQELIAGNAPILIERINGEIRVMGISRPVEVYLNDYEATLPPARLQMTPSALP